MTEPLSPSQEAAVQEAVNCLQRAETRGGYVFILRDLARRLLEPVDILGRRRDGA